MPKPARRLTLLLGGAIFAFGALFLVAAMGVKPAAALFPAAFTQVHLVASGRSIAGSGGGFMTASIAYIAAAAFLGFGALILFTRESD